MPSKNPGMTGFGTGADTGAGAPSAPASVPDQHGAVDLSVAMNRQGAAGAGGAGGAVPSASANSGAGTGAATGVPGAGGSAAGVPGAAGISGEVAAGTEPTALLDASLESEVTEQNFQEIAAWSMTVPVMLLVYSPASLVSKQMVEAFGDVAREARGAFHLAKLNVDATPTLAQALQVQTVPMCVAILAGRPIPVFEGAGSAEQIKSVVDQILQVAPQMGITGRLRVSEEELEKPTPSEHEPALAAEAAGNWEEALAAWRKVLANSPRDLEAEKGVARAEFNLRRATNDNSGEGANTSGAAGGSDLLAQADALFAAGQEAESFALFLGAFQDADAELREEIRCRLVDLFKICSDPQLVRQTRQKLATLLMI